MGATRREVKPTYEITVPRVPVSYQQFRTWPWQKQARLIREWQADVIVLCLEAKVKKHMDKVSVWITVYFNADRYRDTPNYMITLDKFVLDALTHGGYIPNDSPEHVVHYKVELLKDKEHPRTVVRIEEVE